MKIYNKNQYYEAHTRSRLLSIYGTGSVIPTTWGMIMPENIEEWDFIKETLERVKNLEENEPEERQKELSISLRQIKISLINDRRFIQFLQQEKGYEQLEFLVSIPYAELSIWNTLSKDYNNLPIPTTAVHFPKYLYDPDFKTKDTELKEYTHWKELFVKSFSKFTDKTYIKENHFVPPRTYKPRENATNKTLKEEVISRRTLVPVPVILLCPHGHITDIPWAKYINYFSINRKEKLDQEDGEQEKVNLFNIDNCCANPDLLWIGGNMTSEGFEGMSVKCKSCGKSASLRYITSIKPICNGDKPWQEGQNDICTATMQYAITTSNNLYYPQGVNCLYIPFHLISNSVDTNKLRKLEDFYNQYCEKNYVSKQEFINQQEFLITTIFTDSHERKKLISHFLGNNQNNKRKAGINQLKKEEFEIFSNNENYQNEKEPDLVFYNIDVPDFIQSKFDIKDKIKSIRKVENLKLNQVQLSFTRVQPLDIDAIDDENNNKIKPKRIHKKNKSQVTVLPAVETYGEGIFIEIDIEKIKEWEKNLVGTNYLNKVKKIVAKKDSLDPLTQNLIAKHEPEPHLSRFILVHTLAHLLIKELEYSSGYSASAISERIYVNEHNDDKEFAGILLYTADGSQGGMGGLIAQAETDNLQKIIENALNRATDCSSDPICWHSEGQGMNNLNFAACFSCTMISETSCEFQNILLDRRILLDKEYGFFKPKNA